MHYSLKSVTLTLAFIVGTAQATPACQPNTHVYTLKVGIDNPSGNVQTHVESRPCDASGQWERGPRTGRLCAYPRSIGEQVPAVEALAAIDLRTALLMRSGPAALGAMTGVAATIAGASFSAMTCLVGAAVAPVSGSSSLGPCLASLGLTAAGVGGVYYSVQSFGNGVTRMLLERDIKASITNFNQSASQRSGDEPSTTWYQYNYVLTPQEDSSALDSIHQLDRKHDWYAAQVNDIMSDFHLSTTANIDSQCNDRTERLRAIAQERDRQDPRFSAPGQSQDHSVTNP